MDDAQYPFFVSSEEEKKRTDLCLACDYNDTGTDKCTKCDCYLPLKVRQLYEKCPEGKWDRDVTGWDKFYQRFAKRIVEQYPEAEKWLNQSN